MARSAVRVAIRRIAALTEADWVDIRDFGSRYFEGDVVASIKGKRDLVELRGVDGRLLGIGAVTMFDVTHAGRTVTVIHGANTAFVDEMRGLGYVHRVALRYFARAKLRHPRRAVYVAFVTFSWQSYLSMTRSFRISWPRRGVDLPGSGLYERVGVLLDGERFDPGTGVVRFTKRRLRPDISRIPARLADDPDVQFFAGRNPGYATGDSLLCLAPLNAANWWSIVRRLLYRRRARR